MKLLVLLLGIYTTTLFLITTYFLLILLTTNILWLAGSHYFKPVLNYIVIFYKVFDMYSLYLYVFILTMSYVNRYLYGNFI